MRERERKRERERERDAQPTRMDMRRDADRVNVMPAKAGIQ
jgi:hypothetical protein